MKQVKVPMMTSVPLINFQNNYITFLGDDYEKGVMTIIYDDYPPRYLLVSAHKDDIITAAAHVYKINRHLRLEFEFAGWDGDGFAQNILTFKLKVI